MTTQLSTKSRSVHALLGVWKLDETVPVLFEILLHTISTLWAEASVSLTLWRTKCSLDHFKISTQYRSFLRFFIYIYISCHKWAVYADRANTSLRAPVVRRLVPNEIPCHTRHGALHIAACPTFPSRYRLFLTDALWRNAYLKYWVRSGQTATPTVSSLDFLISFFVSFL